MTTLVVASCRARATARGSSSGGNGVASLRSAGRPPVKIASPRSALQPAPEDADGRVVGGGHRALAVDDHHTLFEGGHGGGVAPLDGHPRLRFLLGQLAFRHVAHDHLEGGLATPAGAGAGHLDGGAHAVVAHHASASKPFTTSPGSLQLRPAGPSCLPRSSG